MNGVVDMADCLRRGGVQRGGVAAVALATAAGVAVCGRLDMALMAMHRAGDVAGGFNAVATPSGMWSGAAVRQVIRAWRDWDADRLSAGLAGHFAGPKGTVISYALVHVVLVALPVALALLWAVHRLAGSTKDRSGGGDTPAAEPWLVARIAQVFAAAYFAATATLDLLVALAVKAGNPAPVVLIIGLLAALTEIALIGAAVSLVSLALLWLWRERARDPLERAGQWLRRMAGVRAQVVTALLVAVLVVALQGDIGLQVDDLAMRWLDEFGTALLAIATAGFASWLTLVSGQVCWNFHSRRRPPIHPPRDPWLTRWLWAMMAGGAVLALTGLVVSGILHLSVANIAIWPGCALLLFAGFSLPRAIRSLPMAAREVVDVEPPTLLWVAAGVPLAALEVIAARAAATLFVSQELRAFWLIAIALAALTTVALTIGYRFWLAPGRWVAPVSAPAPGVTSPAPTSPVRRNVLPTMVVAGTAGAVALAAAVVVGVWPIRAGQMLGAVSVLYLWAAALVVVLSLLTLFGELWTPAGTLALLRLRRVPVLTFMAIWVASTIFINTTDHYHDIRLGPPLASDQRPVSVETAVNQWIDRHRIAGTGTRQQVPMVFVSASGGGIRAAYWTAMVLNCLFAANPVQQECVGDRLDPSAVFAESGISGGSVGLVTDRVLAGTDRTYAGVFGHDLTAPDAAALAFRDLPIGLLRLDPPGVDRATVLEQTWERAVGSPSLLQKGLFADAYQPDGKLRFPLLLLNGATVDDGCRLVGSALTTTGTLAGPSPVPGSEDCRSLSPFQPGREDVTAAGPSALANSKDLYDFLCPPHSTQHHDLALSTAGLLSARFPFISPTASLNGCDDPQWRTYDIDGGLLETSGTSTLTEMWATIAGQIQAINDNPAGTLCIQPRLLMIDNGYLQATTGSAPSQPNDLLAGVQGQSQVTDLRSARAEHAAAIAFDHALGQITCPDTTAPSARVARLVPVARPGPRAPLGWSLSTFARNDLEEQLNSPANRCQIALVRSWFHDNPNPGTNYCLTGFAAQPATALPSAPAALEVATGPLTEVVGVPGVRLSIDKCEPAPQITCSVTTDASGRFALLLPAGQANTLTATWGQARLGPISRPASSRLVDTSLNLLITGTTAPPHG